MFGVLCLVKSIISCVFFVRLVVLNTPASISHPGVTNSEKKLKESALFIQACFLFVCILQLLRQEVCIIIFRRVRVKEHEPRPK